ncbi:ADP-L-glycero-D-manno-heptose 6-epimerase [Phycisphaerales bacterium]|nr:ADP-L-glycero-D-manno-heptose 6-epimerase [Phycisphaerales bacterium]
MSDRKSYIVTGGAGFVGANLVAELAAREPSSHVIVIDNFRSGSFNNIIEACDRRGVGPFTGDVVACSCATLDWDARIDLHEPRAVFHLGAITDTTVADESEMIRENVGGFERLMAVVADSRERGRPLRVVYASSAATYGTPPHTARREAFPLSAAGKPNNVYGFSKWLMESVHRRWMEKNDALPVVGLRYFNVFGPGEARKGKMASMVYQIAGRMLRGEPPRLFTDGSQARDQVYVDDVVDCTLAAAGIRTSPSPRPPRPGVYNLGSGVATSFNEVVDSLRTALDIPASRLATEYFDMPPAVREFYQDYTRADMSETERGLGWRPSHEPMTAIRTYATWLARGSAR